MLAWFDGALVGGRLDIDPAERGLLLGDGIFETIAVINGKAVWFGDHLRRMAAAAGEMGLAFDEAACRDAAGLLAGMSGGVPQVLRLTLMRGAGARGLAGNGATPRLLATLDPAYPKPFAAVTLATSSVRRNEHAPSSRLKTLSYADAILAAREARSLGAEDALMLNTAGFAASSTIANLFFIKRHELVTPSPDQGVLPGIVRAKVLALAERVGLRLIERKVERHEPFAADAAFLTNSLRFLRPVASIDGTELAIGPCQPVLRALAAEAMQECGADPQLI